MLIYFIGEEIWSATVECSIRLTVGLTVHYHELFLNILGKLINNVYLMIGELIDANLFHWVRDRECYSGVCYQITCRLNNALP